MFRRLDDKFTHFSIAFDNTIRQRSLLNVPQKYWVHFKVLNYIHGFASILLFIMGSICFCLGVQHSQYYTKVNCGDGSGLWPPIVNMISAVAGQYAMRIVLYWPSFIHLALLFIAIPFLLLLLIDSAVAVPWWMNQPIITFPPDPADNETTTTVASVFDKIVTLKPKVTTTPFYIPQWKDTFAEIDLGMAVVAGMNMLIILLIMTVYARWWFPVRVQRNEDIE